MKFFEKSQIPEKKYVEDLPIFKDMPPQKKWEKDEKIGLDPKIILLLQNGIHELETKIIYQENPKGEDLDKILAIFRRISDTWETELIK